MNRAYSIFNVKAVSADRRMITGVATTPTPDRVGDIIEPLGVKFANPLPLLHQHDSRLPVGQVKFNKATKDGITFEASLPHIDEPGPLKDRVDTAWGELKHGLIRGVSIGFKPIEHSFMEDGGVHFLSSEVVELSLVTVPMNSEATIQTIKSFDTTPIAAAGKDVLGDVAPASREEAFKRLTLSQRSQPKTKGLRTMSKTIAEQISAFEATRAAKAARMGEIQQKAVDDGRSKDETEKEEFDTLEGEIKSLDSELGDLAKMDAINRQTARPVVGNTADAASESRGAPRVIVREMANLPKGIALARYAKCKALAFLSQGEERPTDVAKRLYPDYAELEIALKTAVAAGTTGVVGYAGALVGNETTIFADFAEFLRPLTIIGQFGAGGIPSLRRVPFRTRLLSQTAGGTGYWVGEGQPKPVTNFTFASTTLLPYKAAAITALSMEVIRDSSPSAETIIRDQLAQAVASRMDTDFLDPQKGLDSASPASISNGLTPIDSTGRDADSVRADLVNVFAQYITNNNTPSSAVWVMSAITALQLSLMTNALGQPEFPGMSMTGGRLQGLPVITSEFLGYTFDSPTEGRDVFLVNAGDIYFGDDGGVEVKMSTEASLQMDDAPTVASGPSVTATSLVSMFQTNSVAFLAERTISWKRRRTEGVVHLKQVEWGEASGVNI